MFGYKKYVTVIMDGSSKFVNQEIAGMIDMMTNRRIGKSKCRAFDKSHPTMKVIKRYTNPIRYWEAKRLIEQFYPGVCTFDVNM